jgi:hypothetical protein
VAGFGERDRLVAAFQVIGSICTLGLLGSFGGVVHRDIGSIQLHLVPMATDGELIPGLDAAFHDAHAIDANPVRAAKIAHDKKIMNLRYAAMTPGNLARVDLDVALRMSAKEQDRLIQKDARAVGQRD